MPETIELLKRIWEKEIAADYQKGLLGYEATLQAALYHHLRSRHPHLKVFAEGAHNLGFFRKQKPDLIICRGRHVEIAMELKFWTPPPCPAYEGDCDKLIRWAKKSSRKSTKGHLVQLLLNPVTIRLNDSESKWFEITKDTKWAFAVISGDGCDAIDPEAVREFLRRKWRDCPTGLFWHFVGVVTKGHKPTFGGVQI